ncbi:hypothetical protein V2J09_006329 [Rumex salicifolius]
MTFDQDYDWLSDEEEPVAAAAAEEEEDDLVADVVDGGQGLHFLTHHPPGSNNNNNNVTLASDYHDHTSCSCCWDPDDGFRVDRDQYNLQQEAVIADSSTAGCRQQYSYLDLPSPVAPMMVSPVAYYSSSSAKKMKLSRDDDHHHHKFLILAPPETSAKKDDQMCHRNDEQDELALFSYYYSYYNHYLKRDGVVSEAAEKQHGYDDEVEWAYVAQICVAWELLSSWDYSTFRCRLDLRRQQGIGPDPDPGFPTHAAQQLQHFQVLLQRYIENEPYECDYEEDEKQATKKARISSALFLNILQSSIRTFMEFLKADKESCCQAMITALFRIKQKGGSSSVDPTLVLLMTKTNRKKKLKLKKLQRAGKCIRRKKKVTKEEEMQMLMGLIDLKVVARVLRMRDLTRHHLRWCDEKMTKLTLSKNGRLHRDPSPLTFPALPH